MSSALLIVKNLNLFFKKQQALFDVNYQLYNNEILGIVGESGSGKSISSLAVMQLLDRQVARVEGHIFFENQDLLQLKDRDMQQIRAQKIGMVFQEPMSALNPSMTCGKQVDEVLKQHTKLTSKEIKNRTLELFTQVKLPDPNKVYESYPHQISGGQKQRVVIAMAIACQPKILIADEPTTALDVTVQKDILELLKHFQNTHDMSIIFISHDLNLIKGFCDRVLVMQKGHIVEQGNTKQIFEAPQQTYTKALIATKPPVDKRYHRLLTIKDFENNQVVPKALDNNKRLKNIQKLKLQTPLLEIVNLKKTYWNKIGFFGKSKGYKAIDNVSLKIYPSETLGLVGESGCGKSTLSHLILKLDNADEGQILYKGIDILKLKETEFKQLRKDIQIIFQDPFASLNPKICVGDAILEPMKVHGIGKNYNDRKQKVIEILEKVGLSAEHYNRLPKEFSGGQRQRIGIARSIVLEPKLVICDESVSALDVSVQAQVLNLLNDLKNDYGFSYLFISHDLNVVKYMSDHIAVMNKGKIVEYNEADDLYHHPKDTYTKKLLSSVPG